MIHQVKQGGERLDHLAKALMRTEQDGTVEALLSANPGLAASIINGLVPAGTRIVVPEGFVARTTKAVTLPWE